MLNESDNYRRLEEAEANELVGNFPTCAKVLGETLYGYLKKFLAI